MKLKIAHLYPELLNLYGDRGNIISMQKRLQWRGIEAEVCEYRLRDPIDFDAIDILFIGGGSDREQQLVCKRLCEMRAAFADYVERGGVVAAICGGYQLLGHYYKLQQETIEGLGILDLYTEGGEGRLIGNVVIESEALGCKVVGFENHGGRTHIGNHTPLGRVVYGCGNNGEDGGEGVVYKHVVGTYLHGPLLPKNPRLCDWILQCALEQKYGAAELEPLDDAVELAANRYIVNRFHN